jgi:hypothetical protein
MLFPHLDQERMEFVEEACVARQLRVQKLLGFMIVGSGSYKSMPCQYAPAISIRHEERSLRSIKENGVDRFLSQASEVQQLAAEYFRWQG